jgi:ribosomal protein L37AE/L43A
MNALTCPNCGAALPVSAAKAEIAVCEFCGTSFRMPKTLTPEPDMGDLLLGADFTQKTMPGWETVNDDMLSSH